MKFLELVKRHSVRIGLSFAVLLVFLLHVIGVLHIGFIDRMENLAYDVRLNVMMPNTVDPRIVIVDIDERSLLAQGRWPWSRNRLAEMVSRLFDDYKIKVLGFDVVFAEKDESSGLKTLEKIGRERFKANSEFSKALEKIRPTLDYDQMFADTLKGRPVVLGYYFRSNGNQDASVGALPAPAIAAGTFDTSAVDFIRAGAYGANLPVLQKNAAAAGHFNPEPDGDGISRKVAMLTEYNGNLYESLSLAVARLSLNVPKIEAGFVTGTAGENYAGLEWLQLGERRIPVDERVAALIPFRGRQGSFPYISATDIFTGKADPKVLKGAIVLVGTTAPGLMDLRAAPVQNVYAGVEMHANMIAGILDQNIKQRPAYLLGAELVLLLLAGTLLALGLAVLSPLWSTLLAGAVLSVYAMFNLLLWQRANLVMPIASMLLMVAVLYLLNMSYGFFVESRGKRLLAGLFGQYVPPELVDEMAKDPDAFTLEGESRELTVLFSDVRGFTTISEGLDPKQLTLLMNEYLTPMTHVIHRYRGTIDKYMGDAIMAFWGAPVADPDHARHALLAAIGMIDELQALQTAFEAKGWPPINIGVGLNTGIMTVGNMGSEFRMAYTVMGDAVNLGSRLEGLTKQYGVHIIVSEFTREKLPDFVFRELDRVRVKGKDEPVAIYEPIGLQGHIDAATEKELALYREALKLYRAQNWDLAELQFLSLQKAYPGRYLYEVYIERIAYFRANPPGNDWDGAFTFKTK
ncbi:MAG TPA: adenylate/guanylate cyclase domain-containing protein [Novimethylophilus sp.]|jgi:adenylate cyclase|uniref:CHASE2 domain-containing protein n=1 Tax=Novimethylophilus sp. TaxID=2137426 RepID=UPI002F41FD28